MVAGEDHGLVDDAPSTALVVFALFLFLFDEHEVAEDVEEAVAFQHFLPEIAGAVARGVLRVASAALPLGLGGCLDLKGRKRVSSPLRRVLMCTSSGSAAKCTSARVLKRNSGARGSRSSWYCCTACRQLWRVPGFFSSQVATGSPFSANNRSTVSRLLGWQGTCRVTVSLFCSYNASTSSLSAWAGLKCASRKSFAVELEAVAQHVQRALDVEFFD